jgi:Mg-chelatase subunit ChlI
LFFLAFALHPTYRETAAKLLVASETSGGNWSNDRNYLSVQRLVDAAKFYYGKHELHDEDASEDKRATTLNRLGKDLKKWLRNVGQFDLFERDENAVEWWGLQQSEHPEVSNLSMFLLDAPVQAATCERLFKEFARLHTKLRNRLKPATAHAMAQVKYNLRRKYPKDLPEKKGGQAPNNHAILANQHARIDAPVSPARGQPADTNQDADDVSDGEESENEESNEEQEEEEEEEESELENLDHWIAALREAVPDDDDDFFVDSLEPTNADHSDSGSEDEEVPDCFEKRQQNLPVLPEQNDANWPQENKQYFARQTSPKYVRTDKYTLMVMYALSTKLPEGSELPSIMSAYD